MKICENKTKKSAKPLQAFSEPGTIYITKFNNYEKLECSRFIILAKPRIKHRIISRWYPFFAQIFQFDFVLRALVIWTQSCNNSMQELVLGERFTYWVYEISSHYRLQQRIKHVKVSSIISENDAWRRIQFSPWNSHIFYRVFLIFLNYQIYIYTYKCVFHI